MAPYFFFLSDTDAQALSPELLKAARWLEAHPGQAAMKSMRECARQAGVAPATLTRLAHALGHSGFEGLKALFQAGLAPDTNYAARAHALQLAASSDAADWTERLSEAQHANSASAFVLNSRADYDAVASTLLRADNVYFLGMRASFGLAFHLHYSFGLLAPHGVLLQDLGGTLADQLVRMGEQDVLVVVSLAPYTRQSVWAAEQAKAQGVPVVAPGSGRATQAAFPRPEHFVFSIHGGRAGRGRGARGGCGCAGRQQGAHAPANCAAATGQAGRLLGKNQPFP
jgi:DNA-binding MurR/RpiR family transcriptional regulator